MSSGNDIANSRRMIDTRIAAVALLLTASTPAYAAPSATPQVVAKGDVTRAQMMSEIRAVFTKADTDKDNFMSRAEFGARMNAVLNRTPPGTPGAPSKEQAQRMLDAANAAFTAVDANGDGKLSRPEAAKRPLAAFDMMDTDHNGVLTVAEKIAAREKRAGAAMAGTAARR